MRNKLFMALLVSGLLGSTLAFAMEGDSHGHEKNILKGEQTIAATGTLKSIAQDHMSVRIFHNAIPALQWPAMNMPFDVVDHELVHPLEVGDRVKFEFVQKEGKNTIVRMQKQ